MNSKLDGKPTASVAVFQLPGSNSLKTSDAVHEAMEELKKRFPPGLDYKIVFDTTGFTRESIRAVIHTLGEAMILVVLVVLLFLQTWRASVIPLLAVPVSLIGTFGAMAVVGFSLNNLSLFGLVLAIGIVVDDAIVVVENVERNIALGLEPHAATAKAMDEVSQCRNRSGTGALRCIASQLRFIARNFKPILSAIRSDHRILHAHFPHSILSRSAPLFARFFCNLMPQSAISSAASRTAPWEYSSRDSTRLSARQPTPTAAQSEGLFESAPS